MALVEVEQAQIDELTASVGTQQTVVGKLKTDSGLMLGLILDLRTALAAALASGVPPTVVDLTGAIASIDSVTKELTDETTTEEAALNPPPVVVGDPPVDQTAAAAPAAAPVGTIGDLNPNAGQPVVGNVQDHPGNPAPDEPDDASAPHPSPNAGDPTGADSTQPVAAGTPSADLPAATTGTNDSEPGAVARAAGVDGSGAPRTQNAS